MRATGGRHCVRLSGILCGRGVSRDGTMSSGSSGHRVTVPEPLCSILFLIRRIVDVVGSPGSLEVGSRG